MPQEISVKDNDGNVPFNATNDGEAYGFHPGIIVVSSMDGATHTLSESMDVRSFGSMITRSGGGDTWFNGVGKNQISSGSFPIRKQIGLWHIVINHKYYQRLRPRYFLVAWS